MGVGGSAQKKEPTDADLRLIAEGPTCLGLNFLCEWLNPVDLFKLGQAVADSKKYSRILDFAFTHTSSVLGEQVLIERELLEWLGANKQKLHDTFKCIDLSNTKDLRTSEVLKLIGKCHNLKHADFTSSTRVVREALQMIGRNCRELHSLNLRNCNHLKSSDLFIFQNQGTRFQFLDVSNCSMVGAEILVPLTSWSNSLLRTLNLKNCTRLETQDVMEICRRCTNLETLDISNVNVDDDCVVAVVESCPKLRNFHLSGNHLLTVLSIIAVTSLIHLETLNLEDCFTLNEDCIDVLILGATQLKFLGLKGCFKIRDEALIKIAKHCRQLQEVTLYYCDQITNEGLEALAEHCSDLKALNLQSCGKTITTSGLLRVSKECAHLESLDLSFFAHLDDSTLISVAQGCRKLRHLNLRRVKDQSDISDTSLLAFAQWLPMLTSINLEYSAKITDRGIIAVVTACKHLLQLNLNDCVKISDKTLLAIAEHLPNVRELCLEGLPKVSDVGVLALSEKNHRLTKLDLLGSKAVTSAVYRPLANNCPLLTTVSIHKQSAMPLCGHQSSAPTTGAAARGASSGSAAAARFW
eukprot:CAMPEP_0174975646 /NCGR_PEP_ID=MMETSP0004_2-20121128/12563_1 /TAXON_ID=420556 /ORGANISM="Ochromonas sp., Strain CCMP1393" /LENGTH=580 /DNA_ID=CAMNT_0016226529 /DNA_START=46 /DNA_END=1785 /DNA_ORIENTATION=+